jgi:hypothetical protein
MFPMIPRTFGLVSVYALCLAQFAMADTRVSVSGGPSAVFTPSSAGFEWVAAHLTFANDAPPMIRQYVPLALALSAEGPYTHTVYIADDGEIFHAAWDHGFATAEVLRFYLVGQNYDAPGPDVVELGLGLGFHQFWPYASTWSRSGEHFKLQHLESQWRGHVFFKVNLLPELKAGPFLEAEWQHILDDHRAPADIPSGALTMSLGWYFQV